MYNCRKQVGVYIAFDMSETVNDSAEFLVLCFQLVGLKGAIAEDHIFSCGFVGRWNSIENSSPNAIKTG